MPVSRAQLAHAGHSAPSARLHRRPARGVPDGLGCRTRPRHSRGGPRSALPPTLHEGKVTKTQAEAFADLQAAVAELQNIAAQMLGSDIGEPGRIEILVEQAVQQLTIIRFNAAVLKDPT